MYICVIHLFIDNLELLNNNSNIKNTFTAHQIENLIRIMDKNGNYMNFENVNEMPYHICHYWTGLSVLEFLILYNYI